MNLGINICNITENVMPLISISTHCFLFEVNEGKRSFALLLLQCCQTSPSLAVM